MEDLQLAVVRDMETQLVQCKLCESISRSVRPLKGIANHLQKSHGINGGLASKVQAKLKEAMAAGDGVVVK